MHDLCLTPVCAACPARALIQPENEGTSTPAEVNLMKSRRDKPLQAFQKAMVRFLSSSDRRQTFPFTGSRCTDRAVYALVIEGKLAGVQDRPEDIAVSL